MSFSDVIGVVKSRKALSNKGLRGDNISNINNTMNNKNRSFATMKKNYSQLPSLEISKKLERESFFQANEISRSIYSCSIVARKVIALASSLVEQRMRKLQWNNKDVEIPVWIAKFSIAEFIKKFEIADSGQNYDIVKKAILECQDAKIILEKEKGFKSFNWFYSVEFNPDEDFVEMTFSPDVGSAIYDFKSGYTAMRFKMIGGFKSIYTFRFYEIAVSFIGNKGKNGNKKGTWYFEYSIDELKNILGLKINSYPGRTNAFLLNVVQKPIEELNKVNNEFEIAITKIKKGRNVIGIRFECSEKFETKEKLKITKADSFEEKQEKQAIQSEEEFFKKHEKELELIRMGLQALASELELHDGGFSLNIKARTELIKKHQDEWNLLQSK